MPRPFRRIADSTPHLDIAHGGEVYRVTLKRVASARRFTLRVRAATRDVVLTMPPRGSVTGARSFAQRHAAWIGVRLSRLPQPAPFGPGSTVPLRGVAHEIAHSPVGRKPVWVETGADSVPRICVSGALPHLPRRVRDYLVREARRDLEAAVARHTARLGVAARRLTLRDTTSRWGSCSSAGALNFSWRLIMAPPFVLDYLAAHEVTHLVHMHHGPAFWRLLGLLSPDVERAESWLKTQGLDLLRFGPFKA
jgi:predicted metal-dependent hydrolase